jgi:hypothetical protein
MLTIVAVLLTNSRHKKLQSIVFHEDRNQLAHIIRGQINKLLSVKYITILKGESLQRCVTLERDSTRMVSCSLRFQIRFDGKSKTATVRVVMID